MAMTDDLFYEDLPSALRHVIAVAGGAKVVGARLFPHLKPDGAGQRLLDSLRPDRREHLDLDQLQLLLRIGRESGCHVAMRMLAEEAGYEPPRAVSPDAERAQLQDHGQRLAAELASIVKRMERLAR